MSKFKFTLEKVLRIREFEEEQAKVELGKAIQETERIKRTLEYIARQRVKTNNDLSTTIDIMELQSYQNYIFGLDTKKNQLLEDLAKAELVVEEKTGYIFEDENQLASLLKKYAGHRDWKSDSIICDFYKEKYDWERNMKTLLEGLVETDE